MSSANMVKVSERYFISAETPQTVDGKTYPDPRIWYLKKHLEFRKVALWFTCLYILRKCQGFGERKENGEVWPLKVWQRDVAGGWSIDSKEEVIELRWVMLQWAKTVFLHSQINDLTDWFWNQWFFIIKIKMFHHSYTFKSRWRGCIHGWWVGEVLWKMTSPDEKAVYQLSARSTQILMSGAAVPALM